jgi:membrane dipeptidase
MSLAADIDRLPAFSLALDAAQQRRVTDLLAGMVVSLHDHPVRLPDPLTPQTWRAHADTNADRLGEVGLERSALDVVFASALAEPDQRRLLAWAAALRADLAASPRLRGALGWADVMADGRPSVLLALEDLGSIGTDLDGVSVLHGAGFRSAGLTYNSGNPLGGGLGEPTDAGLTKLGRRAVALMNELGMVVDLSHVGDRTSVQAAAVSSRPVVVSHAGARALWPSPRMKPDEVLRAVADTDGIVGVEAAPGSTRVDGRTAHDLDAVMAHVEYIADLVGVDHVGLGPDTFFGDHTGLYAAAGWQPMPVPGREHVGLPAYVAGMENPGEAPGNAAGWLVCRGWSNEDIAKVLGGNAARVLKVIL